MAGFVVHGHIINSNVLQYTSAAIEVGYGQGYGHLWYV